MHTPVWECLLKSKRVQDKSLRERFYVSRRSSMSKTVLITGTSSGFGRDTAETLFRAGHTVYASMRGAQGKNREAAEALRKLGIKTVELHDSDDASVDAGGKPARAQ